MGDGGQRGEERWEGRRFLATLSVFEGLEDSGLRDLERHSSRAVLEAGESLSAPGPTLTIVVSGLLHLLDSSAARTTGARLGPGDLFADAGLRFYLPTALKAAERSEILTIPGHVLDALLTVKPSLWDQINAEASRHLLRLHLVATPIFHKLDETLLGRVAAQSEFVGVKRGEVIIREGGAPDCMYIVVRGSLEVFRETEFGAVSAIDILSDGACVGEMAILTNEPRSARVRARRDSILIRVSAACFEELLHRNAEVTLQLARTLSERLKRTTKGAHRKIPIQTIAYLRWCEEPAFADFCQRLVLAFQNAGNRVTLPPDGLSSDQDRYSAWLAAAERAYDYVLCPCDSLAPKSTGRSILQADLVLFVTRLGDGAPKGEVPPEVETAWMNGARIELALLRGSGGPPRGTSGWLDLVKFDAHHHLVLESDGDYDRLVRRLSGTAWGLVLGGGGARGLAHLGVIRALREGGIPIDMVGGTSMGAILAAQCAMGCDDRQMLEMTRRAYAGSSGPFDLTVPFVSLHTGRGTIGRLKEMFADRWIEDLPIGYFCVSCNLTRAETEIHDRGPVWLWTRVSCSVPGLLPPVPYHGDVLVDGGLLDNLPVDAMRNRLAGSVAAADVSVAVDLTVDDGLEPGSPWSGALQTFRQMTNRPRLPNIVNVLMRTAEISSVRDSKVAGNPADLYLHVPVDGISMTDFQQIDRIVALGYEYTVRRLEAWRSQEKSEL